MARENFSTKLPTYIVHGNDQGQVEPMYVTKDTTKDTTMDTTNGHKFTKLNLSVSLFGYLNLMKKSL
jgi:hypothetical protein